MKWADEPGTESVLSAGQLSPRSRVFKMKGVTDDHVLKPEQFRILSEAEPALHQHPHMHEATPEWDL